MTAKTIDIFEICIKSRHILDLPKNQAHKNICSARITDLQSNIHPSERFRQNTFQPTFKNDILILC